MKKDEWIKKYVVKKGDDYILQCGYSVCSACPFYKIYKKKDVFCLDAIKKYMEKQVK